MLKPDPPKVRPLHVMNGEGYSKDMGILWAAYKAGSFKLPEDMEQDKFAAEMSDYLSRFGKSWIVDDRNQNFSGKRGPVGIVVGNTFDLVIEIEFGFFKWATKRNILRSTASFLNMVKNFNRVGICLIRVESDKRTLADHMKKYELLHYVGRTSPKECLYSIRGRAS